MSDTKFSLQGIIGNVILFGSAWGLIWLELSFYGYSRIISEIRSKIEEGDEVVCLTGKLNKKDANKYIDPMLKYGSDSIVVNRYVDNFNSLFHSSVDI